MGTLRLRLSRALSLSALLLASSPAAAEASSGVIFSRPVPLIHPGAEYRTCLLGIFPGPQNLPLVHNWYVMARGAGPQAVTLLISAVAVSAGESGDLQATVTDAAGNVVGSVSIPYPTLQGETTEGMLVTLIGGVIYNLTFTSLPISLGAQHYKVGAVERSVELGWAGPLHYLEGPKANWAFHAQQGEDVSVRIEVDAEVDANGVPVPGVPNQATNITYAVLNADLTPGPVPQTLAPISPTQPIVINFTSDEDRSYILQVTTNGHYRAEKLSGADRGFYATPCPPVQPQPFRVKVDIKPGSDPNSINLKKQGLVPVAVLTIRPEEADAQFAAFDATLLEAGALRMMDLADFAPGIFPAGAIPIRSTVEDVDGDGDLDLLLFFEAKDLASQGFNGGRFDANTTAAILFGRRPGQPVFGLDAVNTVGR
ncbi:MAG: hypothetical protein HY726_04415 [Candidatus Rokubacteria bacterium]|nr:hypothetical protein [Candidatus Rokubacteria bacterium]